MNRYIRLSILLCAFALALLTLITSRQGATLKSLPSSQEQNVDSREFQEQFPIVDYAAPQSNDPEQRARRQTRNSKYDKASIPLNASAEKTFIALDWEAGLPALPVAQSDAVVIGRIANAQAYLSNDRTGVYSEFTINIEKIFKNDNQVSLKTDTSIAAERDGGRVRFPSGHISLVYIAGQGLPRIGQRYVLFLTHNFPLQGKQGADFYLLTGYELRANYVFPLDNPSGGTHPIATTYKGAEKKRLLSDLQILVDKASKD